MKKKLLLLTPGPKMAIDTSFFERLSDYFTGAILTTSDEPTILATKQVASFTFNCERFSYNKFSTNTRFIFFCIRFAFRERFRGEKYDLVVTYDPLKTGFIGMFVAKILGAKFSPEVNGVYTSDAEYLDDANTLSIKIKKRLIPFVMGIVLKRADGIKLLFDTQITPFKNKVKDVAYIESFPCYVATDKFVNIREDKIVLFAGFPFKRKAVDVLIEAFKMLADKHPDWKLKILGWFKNIDELNNAINGHPQIFHHPPVYYQDMPEHIGSCAFVVLPSRSEAMGRVLVEAMAAGKPRIGSNVDGIPTVINDNEDGLLVEPGNVKDLAEKMDKLMSDSNLRKKLGDASAKRAKDEFTDDVYFNNMISFYKKLI